MEINIYTYLDIDKDIHITLFIIIKVYYQIHYHYLDSPDNLFTTDLVLLQQFQGFVGGF